MAPAVPFAHLTDDTLKDPDNATKAFRIDFARVEREVPLSHADLAKITPQNIAKLSQEQVDQIYGRLTAGPGDGSARDGRRLPHFHGEAGVGQDNG